MMQKEYSGFGSIRNLRAAVRGRSFNKIFLVTGGASYSLCGAQDRLRALLSGREVFRFSGFSENPKIADVERGIRLFRKEKCDSMIAIGGGSAIDIAKLINIGAAHKWPLIDYLRGNRKIQNKGKPFIAIPTTAGSGSEATHFAVVYVKGVKHSLGHKYLLPDVAIIDPQFTFSMPPRLTAVTGMDALSQAIESYWCIHSTEESKRYAKEAIVHILKNLLGYRKVRYQGRKKYAAQFEVLFALVNLVIAKKALLA
jgi:alcohol dehydrogenase class IV